MKTKTNQITVTLNEKEIQDIYEIIDDYLNELNSKQIVEITKKHQNAMDFFVKLKEIIAENNKFYTHKS